MIMIPQTNVFHPGYFRKKKSTVRSVVLFIKPYLRTQDYVAGNV